MENVENHKTVLCKNTYCYQGDLSCECIILHVQYCFTLLVPTKNELECFDYISHLCMFAVSSITQQDVMQVLTQDHYTYAKHRAINPC